MNETKKTMLVTAALPYANGDIHIGHLVEYTQADFWVRFQRMLGHECIYICADDTHGTPIMISARKEGITPEDLIARSHAKHIKDFNDMQIRFNNFGSTNSEDNRKFTEEFFEKMVEQNHVDKRSIEQLYCEKDTMFLPDRFVRGTCPKCDAEDQYGDSCDNCSSTYSPTDLKEPQCSICGTPPVAKQSEHIFFQLDHFRDFLKDWVKDHASGEVTNKLDEWLKDALRDWDISRDAPYFGFEIPGYEGKYFYVWLDAPVGYLASTMEWCRKEERDFDRLWRGEDTEIYHFIGKDIVYFHTLFWPAMLKTAGYKLPEHVFVHGFLTVDGEKMSKSRGTFINARTYLDHLDPLYLRFYLACKLNASINDIDLSLEDFVNRVNSDLVGKITNLASRGLQMLHKNLGGKLGSLSEEGKVLLEKTRGRAEEIAKLYHGREFSRVMILLRDIADGANRYFDEKKPWSTVKTEPEETRQVLTDIANVFRILTIYLKPILPTYADAVEKMFREVSYTWESIGVTLEECETEPYAHLIKRMDKKALNKMIEASKEGAPKPVVEKAKKEEEEPIAETINFDTFMKVDLRVARIVEVEEVKEARKLLRLTVDLGFEKRQVIAGIKSGYKPEDLLNRLTVIAANLEPRKMKFGVSEGMILAAGPGGKDIFILSPDDGAKPGQRIH